MQTLFFNNWRLTNVRFKYKKKLKVTWDILFTISVYQKNHLHSLLLSTSLSMEGYET